MLLTLRQTTSLLFPASSSDLARARHHPHISRPAAKETRLETAQSVLKGEPPLCQHEKQHRDESVCFDARPEKDVSSEAAMNEKDRDIKHATCVVLFDIDGTLLTGPDDGPSAGFKAMGQAAKKITGKDGVSNSVEFAGRTDLQIARSLLVAAGEQDPPVDRVAWVVSHYVRFLGENVNTIPYAVLGDPRAAVNRLRQSGAIVELGTGNVRAGAEVKLTNAGIEDLFNMEKGGFGGDGDTRAEVLETGARHCDPTRRLPVVIVGDTPHDVSAAHEIGAKCIGVPYRHNDTATLKAAGADAIIEYIDNSLIDVVRQFIGIL